MASRDGFLTRPDGVRLHYCEYGARSSDRPPLLCLSGVTRNARDFEEFARRMAPRHHVVTFDFRGRGQSAHDPQPDRYTPPVYVDDVVALLDHLGIADAIIVGTSLGGIVAMLLAVKEPERIAATVLNDVGPALEAAGLERIRGYVGSDPVFADWSEAAEAAKAMNRGLPLHWGEGEWETMARRLCREDSDGNVRPDYDPQIAAPFRAAAGANPTIWPLFDALAEKPVLVIHGAESDLLSAATVAAMAERGPTVSVATVLGVGHAPDLSEPEALAAIERFLARLKT